MMCLSFLHVPCAQVSLRSLDLQIYGVISFRRFLVIISQIFFLFSSLSWDHSYTYVRPFEVVPQLTNAIFLFFLFLRILSVFHFGQQIILLCLLKFTNLFSYMSNLPLIPSSVFYTSDIIVFISRSLSFLMFSMSLLNVFDLSSVFFCLFV